MSSAIPALANKEYYDPNILQLIRNSDLWLDFSDTSTLTTTNGNRNTLTAVTDKSSTPKTVTMSGTSYYDDSVQGYYNNNSSSNFMTTTYTGPTVASPNETIFLVISHNQLSNSSFIGTSTTGCRWVGSQGTTQVVRAGIYPNFQVVGTTGLASGIRYLISVTIVNGVATIFLNGRFEASGSITIAANGTNTTISRSDATWFNRGNIHEVIAFASAMPDSQRQAIEYHLLRKWLPTNTISSPLGVTGCTLWFDGNDEATITYGTGTAVAQWNDKSGNNFHATQGTAGNRPSYNSTLKGVTFTSASSTFMNSSAPFNRTNESIFIVFRWQGTGSGGNPGLLSSPTVSGDTRSLLLNTSDRSLDVWNSTAVTTLNGLIQQPINVPNLVEYRNSINTGNTFGYLNAGNANDAPVNTTGISYSTTAATFRIGSSNNANFLQGTIHEIIVFNKVLTGAERVSIRNYLINKWNIAINVSLISQHPYSSVPPFLRYFVPTDITACSLWLDAADATTLTLNASSFVTQWRDKSGNGYNATGFGNTALQTLGNNNRAIFFDNATTYFFASNATAMNNTGNLTVIAVGTFVTPPTANVNWLRMVSFGDPDFNNNTNIVALERFAATNAITVERTGTPGSGTAITLNTPFIASSVNTTTTINLFVNGTAGYSTSFTTKNNFNYSLYNIGRFSGSGVGTPGTFVWSGLIGEVIAFNRNLNRFERQLIEGYLAWKWGLRASLPSTHPYFNELPLIPRFDIRKISPPLALWLDASDPYGNGTVPAVGTAFPFWIDKSGRGISIGNPDNPTQQPTFAYDGGYPALAFNASQGLSLQSGGPITNAITTSIFFVAKALSAVDGGFMTLSRSESPRWANYQFDQNASTVRVGYRYNRGSVPVSQKIGTTSGSAGNKLMIAVCDSGTTSTSGIFFLNGTEFNSVNMGGTSANTITTEVTIRIGSSRDNFANTGSSLDGFFHEVIIFNQQLPAIERQQVEGYLAWKWGLQSSLPSTHTYAKFPPF